MIRHLPPLAVATLAFAGATVLCPPVCAGEGDAKAPASAPAKAPVGDAAAAPATGNPLDAPDPFVGEYSSEQMLVVVRLSVDGYVGEIRRGGKTYPMKAVVDGGKLTGQFSVDQTSYAFTAVLDGATLKLTTGTTSYTLPRKSATGAPPVPPPPIPTPPPTPSPSPTPTPAPAPQPPTPVPTPVPAPLPLPAPVEVKPVLTGPLPQHLGYAQLSTQKLNDLSWARFPAGAFAVFEESVTTSAALPSSARRKLVLTGLVDSRPRLRHHDWDGSKFDALGQAVVLPESESLVRISELGYAKGQANTESLTVQGVTLRCLRVPFDGESKVKGVPMRVAAEVWRSSEVDVPPLVVDLPHAKLLLEPDIVRIKLTCEFRGITGVIDFKLDTISNDVRIGEQIVRYAVVKSTSTFDRGDGKIESTAEYWLSSQVPGGILKTMQTERSGEHIRNRNAAVVEFSVFPKN